VLEVDPEMTFGILDKDQNLVAYLEDNDILSEENLLGNIIIKIRRYCYAAQYLKVGSYIKSSEYPEPLKIIRTYWTIEKENVIEIELEI
jgi:hypothetical protein